MANEEKKTILMVEDEAIISLSTSKMLRKYGYEVITALKGEKAIEVVLQNPSVNLILMDINLGKGMDGVEAAKKILEIKPIPIIFLTSHSEQSIVDKVKSITRYGYVIKNSGEFVLLESINMAYELFDVNRKLVDDINERKNTERELTLSESKFETIFSSNPSGISINDINTGEFFDVNEAFANIVGLKRNELIGKDPFSLNLWNEEYNLLLTKDLMEKGKLQNREIVYSTEAVGIRNIVVSCELIELSGKTCVLTILNDITENKKNQEALSESKKVIEATHKAAMIENWRYEYTTGKLYLGSGGSLSGYNLNTMDGFDFFISNTHPLDIEYHKSEIEKLKSGKPISIEVRLILNGEIRWFLVKAEVEIDPQNKPLYAIGVTVDITDRKFAEEENKKNISLLKATLESTTDGILVVDLNGNINSYNKRFAEMWGIPDEILKQGKDELALKNVFSKLSDPDKFLEKVNWLYRNPDEESFDNVYLNNGRIFERYSIPQVINNEIAGRVWSFRDVTEKVNFEKALIRSEEKTRAVISAVPDLIFIVNKDGVYLDYISSTDKKLIASPDNFIGKSFYEVLDKNLADNAVKSIKTALIKNELVTFEYDLILNGSKNFFESRIVPFTKDKVLIIVRDITDEKNNGLFALQRENILKQTSKFAELIFNTGLNDANINYIISGLGNAFNLSRTYIFKKTDEDSSRYNFTQLFEWCKPGIFSSAEVLDVKNFSIEKDSPLFIKFGKFLQVGHLEGYLNEMDNEYEQYVMNVQNLKSYLFIAINVNNSLWGMIGFDECEYERKWTEFEIQTLKTAANLLAGALQNAETEKELALSRQMYFDFIFNSPDSVTVSNTDGRIIFSSKKALELFGYVDDDDLAKMTIMDFVSPKSRSFAYSKLLKILETGEYDSNVFTVKRKDGSEFEAEVNANAYYDSNGKMEGLIIVCRDITEKLETERKLTEEHIRRKLLIDDSGDGIVVLDDNGKVFEANKKFAEMLGYSVEEIMTRFVWDWDHNFDKAQIKELIASVDESGHHFETVHTRKDGSKIDVELSNNGTVINGKKLIFCVCRDVTKRNIILKKLKESETKFSKIFNNSPVGISIIKANDMKYVDVNEALIKMSGYRRSEFIGKTPFGIGFYSEEINNSVIEYMKREKLIGKEFVLTKKDGSPLYILMSREKIILDKEVYYITIITDISNQKETEQKLKEEYIRRKILIDESGDGIVVLDDKGNVYEANRKFAEMLGYSEEEIKSKKVSDWDHYFSGEQLKSLIDIDLTGAVNCETVFTKKDSSGFDVEMSINKAIVNGKKLIFCVCRDTTKKNQILQKLKESEERFYKIFKNSPVGISLTRISDGVYVDVNEALLKIGGYTKDEVIGKTTVELKVYDESTRDKFIEKLVKEGRVDAVEHQFPKKDGSIAYVIFSLEIVELNGEKFILGIIMDNTERKLNEIKLKESEEKFSKIFHASPVGIAITNASTGEYLDVNKSLLQMSGKNREDLIGKTTIQTLEFTPDDRAKLVNEIMNNDKVTYSEMNYTMPNGDKAIGAFFMDKFEMEGEKFILTTIFDITDKKKQELAVQKSLKEKEILLKELQHRVKNNLSVISSLLHLEIENLKNDADREIFKNSISRVNSLSAIYEQLYSSDDLENIKIHNYLQKLIDSINTAYGRSELIKIELDVCANCKIDLKRSVVIGLIFNELITNSYKYAFPGNTAGKINVGFTTEGNKALIYVFDNGIGLPDGFNLEAQKSLGLKLVKMMSEQLDGKFKIENKEGTYAEIEFALE